MLGETLFLGLNALDLAVVLGLVTYVVTLVKDWRPITHLRKENADLRADLTRQEERYDELDSKYNDLRARYDKLESSRDFQKAFSEVVRALEGVASSQERMHEQNRQEAAEARKEMRAIIAALDAFAARIPAET